MDKFIPVNKFTLSCKTCGAQEVVITDDANCAYDGDDRMDFWGNIQIVCTKCNERETIYEP
jgi:hypothetical protein